MNKKVMDLEGWQGTEEMLAEAKEAGLIRTKGGGWYYSYVSLSFSDNSRERNAACGQVIWYAPGEKCWVWGFIDEPAWQAQGNYNSEVEALAVALTWRREALQWCRPTSRRNIPRLEDLI